MKKLLCIIICLTLCCLTGCGDETVSSAITSTDSTKAPIEAVVPHKTVVLRDNSVTNSELEIAYLSAFTQISYYVETSGKEYEIIETTEQNALTDMIAQAVDGAKTFICIGSIFSEAVKLCSQSYANLNFVIFDGIIPENEVAKNVLQFSFAYDEAGFIIGYGLVNAGMRNIGFISEQPGYYENEIIKGIVAGAGYAANEKNNPPVSSDVSSTVSSNVSSAVTSPSPNKTEIKITIEKYLLNNLNAAQMTTALDIRKDLKNFRLVCIGDTAASTLAEHPGQFYMLTDSSVEYPRKHLQFGIGGEFDIIGELEKISTAGDGWAATYGGRTVRLSVAQGNITFPVFKLSTTNLAKAKAILSNPTTDLNSDRMKKGYGYVTQTEYKAS
ncbi:MAG: BMP family ABC transporter substrate-binding protein [Clostridia bacterium]|nr:BMP family ABC transporter substrate-binding protein [Clostridia bacterium]